MNIFTYNLFFPFTFNTFAIRVECSPVLCVLLLSLHIHSSGPVTIFDSCLTILSADDAIVKGSQQYHTCVLDCCTMICAVAKKYSWRSSSFSLKQTPAKICKNNFVYKISFRCFFVSVSLIKQKCY